jgi:hypothetical protein
MTNLCPLPYARWFVQGRAFCYFTIVTITGFLFRKVNAMLRIDPNQFPVDLSSLLMPKDFWPERKQNGDPKWEDTIYVGQEDGSVVEISIRDLITTKFGNEAWFAGLQLTKEVVGVQVFIGKDVESVQGNEFADVTYFERGGGGSTLIVAAEKPDGFIRRILRRFGLGKPHYVIALLGQQRLMMDQSGKKILQIIAGYPADVVGSPDQVHRATSISEGQQEALGENYKISNESLINLFTPYNPNNGYTLTGPGQGVATQLLMIPFSLLNKQDDGTYRLSRDAASVADRKLERIFDETFFDLDEALLREIHQPADGTPACGKTLAAVDRAFFYLILDI